MSWICGKSPQSIDAGGRARESGLVRGHRGFETRSHRFGGKANGEFWIWTNWGGRIRDFALTGRSTDLRRVGHALVRFPLQLRALAGAQFERCRGSRTRDLSQGFTRFRVVSAWYQFPGMDVSNPQKHLSKFALKTRPTHDRGDGFGGGWT